jgi:hypothetical protein
MAAVCILLLMNLPPLLVWHETERVGWEGWLTNVPGPLPVAVVLGAETEETYLARHVPSYRAWRALERTPADSVVLTFSGGDHLYGSRSRIWSESAAATAATWRAKAGQESAMLAALRRLGVTHVLFLKRPGSPKFETLAIASARTRECCLVPFYEDERVTVYTVRYPGSLSSPNESRLPAVPERSDSTRVECGMKIAPAATLPEASTWRMLPPSHQSMTCDDRASRATTPT